MTVTHSNSDKQETGLCQNRGETGRIYRWALYRTAQAGVDGTMTQLPSAWWINAFYIAGTIFFGLGVIAILVWLVSALTSDDT